MTPVNPWFLYAEDDKAALEQLKNSDLYRPICFHAQQLAEKLLKGLIFKTKQKIPRTHDLSVLVPLSRAQLSVTKQDLEFLSGLYVETRYPPDLGLLPTGEPDAEDAERAKAIALALYKDIMGK